MAKRLLKNTKSNDTGLSDHGYHDAGSGRLRGVKMIRTFDAQAKVVMCSAMGQQGMVMDAIRAGAVDFIVKPAARTA